jgi:hypothetical protein
LRSHREIVDQHPLILIGTLPELAILFRPVNIDQDIMQTGQQSFRHLRLQAALDKGRQGLPHLGDKGLLAQLMAGNAKNPGLGVE